MRAPVHQSECANKGAATIITKAAQMTSLIGKVVFQSIPSLPGRFSKV